MPRFDPHSWCDAAQPKQRHLDLRLRVDFEQKRLSGLVRIHLAQSTGGVLDLDGRGLCVQRAKTSDGRPVEWHIAHSDPIKGDCIRFDLPPETEALEVEYSTGRNAVALGWLEPEQTIGGEFPFLFTQCHPIHARTIVPCQDTPKRRITFSAEIIVPRPLRALMSAALTDCSNEGNDTVWRFQMSQSIPTYLLALAVGDIEQKTLSDRCSVYAERELLDAAAWEFAGTDALLEAAEQLYGPYEWERFDLLVMPRGFPYGGMENPRLTFITPTAITGDRSSLSLVIHELAHSWTGNLVTNATMNDFWLNEGLTVYAERRLLEEVLDLEHAELQMAVRRNALQQSLETMGKNAPYTKLRMDLDGVHPDDVYSPVPFEKGAQFLRLIESVVGRPRFDGFVRSYIRHFRFRSITTQEFLDFLELELPGVYGAIQGNEWVYGPGMPSNELKISSDGVQTALDHAEAWGIGERPPAQVLDHFSIGQWVIFLQRLPRTLAESDCHWFEENFALSEHRNYDVQVEWLAITAASNYLPALPRIRRFLAETGRLKYLAVVYKALVSHRAGAVFAIDVFESVNRHYHPVSRRGVARIIGAAA